MKRWIAEVKESDDGEYCYIEFTDEMLAESGLEVGDVLKWVDNLDGSYTIMKSDMSKQTDYVLTTEMSNPQTDRSVMVYRSLVEDNFIIDMYEKCELVHSRKISNRTENYTEDCAENWIMKYGEFA